MTPAAPHNQRSVVWHMIGVIAGLLFIAAAFGKATDPAPAIAVFRELGAATWSPISVKAILFILVAFEAAAGAALLVGVRPAATRTLAAITLLAYTGTLLTLAMRPEPIRCGCLGWTPPGMGSQQELIFGIVRNIILAVLLFTSTRDRPPAPARQPARIRARRDAPAFTLIEAMVSIAVIATVIGITLPVIHGARDSARSVRSLAGHRAVAAAWAMHADQNRGRYPFPTDADFESQPHPPLVTMASRAYLWSEVLLPTHPELEPVLHPPEWPIQPDQRAGVWGSAHPHAFFASGTLFADPKYFDPHQEPVGSMARTIRSPEVVHPASKVLVQDLSRTALLQIGEKTPTYAFIDGSAAAIAAPGLTSEWLDRPNLFFSAPGHSTLYGVHGRDR